VRATHRPERLEQPAPADRPQRALGLDLGGTNIKTSVLEWTRDDLTTVRTVAAGSTPTFAERGPTAVVERLADLVREHRAGAGADDPPIVATGLGLPGLFDHEHGTARLIPNLPGDWDGVPLRAPLEAAAGTPVTLINDARAFCLAEGHLGAARGCRVVVGVTLGTGVGGGVLIDGQLQLGAYLTAGEIGHQTVLPDGPRCGCGNRGCVEAVAKAAVLTERAGRATVEEVCTAAVEGDARCLAAIEEVAGFLGIAIANTYHLLGPDRVVIGGGIATAGPILFEPIRAEVARRATLVPTDRIDVRPAALGPAAGAVGAALAAAQASVRAR
jgi:glucokinase